MRSVVALLIAFAPVACSSEQPAPRCETPLPCDVDTVLKTVCQQCHTRPPKEGVPISLVTYCDTQRRLTIEPDFVDTPTWIAMGVKLDAGQMPEEPVTITDAEKKILLDWIAAGAPPAPDGTKCP
jgi:hypothetical protein